MREREEKTMSMKRILEKFDGSELRDCIYIRQKVGSIKTQLRILLMGAASAVE